GASAGMVGCAGVEALFGHRFHRLKRIGSRQTDPTNHSPFIHFESVESVAKENRKPQEVDTAQDSSAVGTRGSSGSKKLQRTSGNSALRPGSMALIWCSMASASCSSRMRACTETSARLPSCRVIRLMMLA